MEPGGSLLCSEEFAPRPYPEPDERIPRLQTLSIKTHFNIILPYKSRSF
jgi:hypothetical protein